jgi:polyisoprenyl-phosphate glycosyltransferase
VNFYNIDSLTHKSTIDISVVLPCYATADCLKPLYERLKKIFEENNLSFELIFINDGSPHDDWRVISELSKKDDRVKGINFARNFGQHTAITAGLDFSTGRWLVVMDADLQDVPEEILKFYNKAQEGFDIVLGRRINRSDGVLKKIGSFVFYKIYDMLTDQITDHTISNYGIYSRIVVDSFCSMREKVRNFSQFIKWLGFNQVYVNINHAKRYSGKSSYSLLRMVRLASHTITALSNKPLLISVQIGSLIALLSFAYGIYLILKYLFLGISVTGWTSLMVSIYFLAGMILMNIGILGIYIGKIFDEVKKRPLYVIKQKINLETA